MTEQETISNEVQMKLALQDAKFNQFMNEMKDFRNETREQNKMRADEISEIRNDIKEISKTTDAKISAIQTAIDGINKQVQNISIAAFVGIGAMVITSVIGIAAMVWSVMNK